VEQNGEKRLGWAPGTEQVPCWMTYTTPRTAEIVRSNLSRSAMYSGEIEGVGPRYCPSIEDKFVRFADKPRHLLFLEPEGRHTNEYYVNGLSTSLPFDVQLEMIHSVPGLENAHLLRPAYAVEYDFAPPTQLFPSLESRKVENLFFAGQINGTSGYEEAAGQGLLAGVNAVNKVRNQEPLVLRRHEAYLGVLVDDLVTKGTNEPYRMFTSRAEHRLLLNHGSAELRLAHHARKYGLVPTDRLERIEAKRQLVQLWIEKMQTIRMGAAGSLSDVVRRAATGSGPGPILPEEFTALPAAVRDEVLYRVSYQGYLEREERQIAKLNEVERIKIPPDFDFSSVRGLRNECLQKLRALRPVSLGQAGRISGVTPADLNVLMVALEAARRRSGRDAE
jgi:tRNA uridine 5-carboxymethylaminomethyl modification enzyme